MRAFPPAALPWDELAFWSTTAALRDALGMRDLPVARHTPTGRGAHGMRDLPVARHTPTGGDALDTLAAPDDRPVG